MSALKKTASHNYNRRRFNDDQIKSLETTFETEARPELRLKQHLAHQLGLQPRQVAIWFQNKRARSKSKHLEREYGLLKSDFDELALKFENLKKENQNLHNQVERLRNMADDERDRDDKDENFVITTSSFALSENNYEMNNHESINNMVIKSHDDDLCIDKYLEEDEGDDHHRVLNMRQIDAEQGSSDIGGGCSFESCNLMDNNTVVTGYGFSQWWGF